MANGSLPNNLTRDNVFTDPSVPQDSYLTLISGKLWNPEKRRAFYRLRCACGQIIELRPYRVKIQKSCGCLSRKGNPKHGHAPCSGSSPEYKAYYNAKVRCTDNRSRYYKNYGGRGIQFRFRSFLEFIDHVGLKPTPRHTLDRKDNSGHYEPGNVRWATVRQQARNTRKTKFITIDGVTRIQTEWAQIAGIADRTINDRIRKGYCVKCAVFAPVQYRHGKPCGHPLNDKDKVWKLK